MRPIRNFFRRNRLDDLFGWSRFHGDLHHLTRLDTAGVAPGATSVTTVVNDHLDTAPAITTTDTTIVARRWPTAITPKRSESVEYGTALATRLAVIVAAAVTRVATVSRMINPRVDV